MADVSSFLISDNKQFSNKKHKDEIGKIIFVEVIESKSRYKLMNKLQQRQVQRIYIYFSHSLPVELNLDQKELYYQRISTLLCSIMSRPTYIVIF